MRGRCCGGIPPPVSSMASSVRSGLVRDAVVRVGDSDVETPHRLTADVELTEPDDPAHAHDFREPRQLRAATVRERQADDDLISYGRTGRVLLADRKRPQV